MTTTTISNLPPEVFHCIFDRCDTYTVFHSVRRVCKRLYQAVNSYKAHALNFTGDSSYNLKLILRLTPIESVTSLAISKGGKQGDRLAKFISHIGCEKFKNLHSLALYEVNCSELDQLLSNVNPESLFSFSLDFREIGYSEEATTISSVLSRLNLRKLSVMASSYIMQRVSYPDNCNLKYLTIKECSAKEYPIILDRLPHLQKLIISSCYGISFDRYLYPPTLKFQPPLTSLSINGIKYEYEYFKSLLLLTPALCHLRLIKEEAAMKDFFDGSRWEDFISNNLPCLINFEFLFSEALPSEKMVPSLDEFIVPFRTSYWLDVKRWFVICEYDFRKNVVQLYTASMNRTNKPNVFILSSKENIYTCNDSIVGRKNLTKLGLSNVKGLKNYLNHIAKLVEVHQTLRELDLSYNSIGQSEAQFLANALQNNTTLTTLNLSNNEIGDRGAQYLGTALSQNKGLIKLDLGKNEIQETGMKYLSLGLQNNTTLVELHLDANDICSNGFKYYREGFRRNLSRTSISSEAGGALVHFLQRNKTIRTFRLRFNDIGDEGMKYFADGLQHNKSLVELDFERNELEYQAGFYLATALKQNTILKILILAQNDIGPFGTKYLADALAYNTSLTTLNLSENEIQDDGARYLATCLRLNKTLTTLDISKNEISNTGGRYLIGALRVNTTLMELDVDSNSQRASIIELIKTLLKQKTLTSEHNSVLTPYRIRSSDVVDIQSHLCSICFDVLWKPITCQSCQAVFCTKCLNEWFEISPIKCPMLCEKYVQGECSKSLLQKLSQLQVLCAYSSSGCKNVMNYDELETHQEQCDYQREQCENCRRMILRKKLTQHVRFCKKRKLETSELDKIAKRTTKRNRCSSCEGDKSSGRKSCSRGGRSSYHGDFTGIEKWSFDHDDNWDIPCSCICHD